MAKQTDGRNGRPDIRTQTRIGVQNGTEAWPNRQTDGQTTRRTDTDTFSIETDRRATDDLVNDKQSKQTEESSSGDTRRHLQG